MVFCGNSSVVERDLAKVDVAGPTPVSRLMNIAQKRTSSIHPYECQKNIRMFRYIFVIAAITGLIFLTGCSHFSGIYSNNKYTIDNLKFDVWSAKSETLNGYRGYSGKVVKITPLNGVNWADFSRSIYYDWVINDTGYQQVTVSMSILVESNTAPGPQIAAYRTSQREIPSPSAIRWNGPANIGWSLQNGDDVYAQFGGNPVTIPTGKWVDLTFSEAVDVTGKEFGQIYLDGHNDHQGLLDMNLYIRHFRVTMRTTNKYIALTFDGGPTDFTDFLLDKLDEHGVKATFFVMGVGMEAKHPVYDRAVTDRDRALLVTERSEILKRMFEEGHDIGNFAYSGATIGDKTPTDTEIRREIENTQTLIQKAVYGDEYRNYPMISRFYRDPFTYGSDMSVKIDRIANQQGLMIIGGVEKPDNDTSVSAEAAAEKLLREVIPWTISVNKDPRSDPAIIRYLDMIIPRLKSEGYIFITISEMAAKRNVPLYPGIVYINMDPDLY